MAAFSRRTSQGRAEGRRSDARAADPPPPQIDPADQVVAAAERIVGDAWIQQLIGHRDQARAGMQTALVRCDSARRALSEAQRARAPALIATAHADVEATLAAAHRAVADFEHVQQGLVLELDMPAWRSVERTVNACIAGNDRPADSAGRGEAARRPTLLSRLFRRVSPWVLCVAASLTAGGWSR